MNLNLPILHLLDDANNILIAGAGGGFDIYAGLPLYFTLKDMGKQVHLANYSFTEIPFAKHLGNPIIEIDSLLLGIRGEVRMDIPYFPEGHLAEWFHQQGKPETVWLIHQTGVPLLEKAYQHLVRKLKIDVIILVDGGVDSLMRGDENNPGTLVDDTISLAAIRSLNVPVKLLASIGFGTEVEENLCHYTALENMAALIKAGGFYGACALTPQMDAFQQYEQACRHAWESGKKRSKSHISTRIIPAVHGESGNVHLYLDDHTSMNRLFISPLMGLYWFFDANVVAQHNLLIDIIRDELTKQDAISATMRFMFKHRATNRPRRQIPY